MEREQLPIVKNPKKILREIATPVSANEFGSEYLLSLIEHMKITLRGTPDGVGLAAPQVGISKRIFIVSEESEEINNMETNAEEEDPDLPHEKPYEIREWRYDIYINPKTKRVSSKKITDTEGCLSVPGKFGIVRRPDKITVEAFDEYGKKFIKNGVRFVARVIQHELDHLEGALFIDKVDRFVEIAPTRNTIAKEMKK